MSSFGSLRSKQCMLSRVQSCEHALEAIGNQTVVSRMQTDPNYRNRSPIPYNIHSLLMLTFGDLHSTCPEE